MDTTNTPFELLPDTEISEIRRKLIEGNGDIQVLGENCMRIMRNVIYTCRMKAHPMQDTPSGETKVKKTKEPSINKKTLSGDAVNDFLG